MVTKTVDLYMPDKALEVIGSTKRFKVLYGGRRSSKTYSFVDAVITRAAYHPTLVLCTRELQKSIRDSIHKTLRVRISDLGLDQYFDIEKSSIYSKCGSEFIFMGVRHNATEIKGLEGIDICLIEEAEKMSQDSWDVLEPTISKDGSEIWVNFNPETEDAPTYQKFVANTHPDCAIAHMTYRDNKFFPEISRKQMEYDREVDPEKYDWVWEGGLKKHHDACIFGDRIVKEAFETPACVQKHYGADWGFSGDPMAINSMFIIDKDLYIDYEFYGHGVDYADYEAAFDTIPGIREGRIRADSSSPASISHMKRLGFDILGAKKGPGSVEDGIRFLRSFRRIVIHERCTGAWDDFSNYRWKQDAQTKEILNIPVDKSNHVPDNVRYALEPMIRMKRKAVAV
jgi:phage terminase large subunit